MGELKIPKRHFEINWPIMPWFHQIMKSEIPRISFHSLNPTERLTKNRTCQLIWWVQITKFGEPCETLWNQWGLKGQMRLRKSFGPIVWSSFLPDSHSGTYQCARSSVCARLRLACAWHYNVAKEFPSSRILKKKKKKVVWLRIHHAQFLECWFLPKLNRASRR